MLSPSRIAVFLTALAALAGALAPAVADLDWSSTAGVMTAVVTIGGVVFKWLDGRSKWEITRPAPQPVHVQVGQTSGTSMVTGASVVGPPEDDGGEDPLFADELVADNVPADQGDKGSA